MKKIISLVICSLLCICTYSVALAYTGSYGTLSGNSGSTTTIEYGPQGRTETVTGSGTYYHPSYAENKKTTTFNGGGSLNTTNGNFSAYGGTTTTWIERH